MRRPSPTRTASLAALGLMTALAGCSGGTPTTTVVEPIATAAAAPVDDGVLMLGVLIPQGSANADIGQAIRSAVTLAVNELNAAGGYGGSNVVLASADEGVAGVGSDPAIDKLLDAHVDAIIGPASSTNALAGLGTIVDAGVVACSPTASAGLLDGFPDNDLFFRTIPSDSLQAAAVAEAVDRTGVNRATVAYIDDAFGQAFGKQVEAALRSKGIEPSAAVAYSADDQSISTAAALVASHSPGVVVVVGDATSGPVMLRAIDTQMASSPPIFVVNDAMRRPTASAEPLGGSLASRVVGISPIAYSTDQAFLAAIGATADNPSPFAANAFDCVNLIALAALAAGSTQPTAIARQIPAISDSGTPCRSFADCSAKIATGSNVDYDGPGGELTIGANGDISAGVFELFGFREDGRDYSKGGSVSVGS